MSGNERRAARVRASGRTGNVRLVRAHPNVRMQASPVGHLNLGEGGDLPVATRVAAEPPPLFAAHERSQSISRRHAEGRS